MRQTAVVVAALTLATGTASRGVRDHASPVAADTRSAEDASGIVVGKRTAVNFPSPPHWKQPLGMVDVLSL